MLDLLLRLLDNIKQLIELRNKRQDAIFEKLIEPTFKELGLVHQDYLETLGQLCALLPSEKDNKHVCRQKLKKARDYVISRSSKLEPVRDKLRAYEDLQNARVREMGHKPTDLDQFLSAVLDYLSWSVAARYPMMSIYRTWMQRLEELVMGLGEPSRDTLPTSSFDLQRLQPDCKSLAEDMRGRWSRVSAIYAKIKVGNVTR